jgi:hypothetical protein
MSSRHAEMVKSEAPLMQSNIAPYPLEKKAVIKLRKAPEKLCKNADNI